MLCLIITMNNLSYSHTCNLSSFDFISGQNNNFASSLPHTPFFSSTPQGRKDNFCKFISEVFKVFVLVITITGAISSFPFYDHTIEKEEDQTLLFGCDFDIL